MKNKITGLIIALFTMVAFTTAKAQCTTIKNNLPSCSINIQITYYLCTPPGVPCNTSPVPMTIAAGSGAINLMNCLSNCGSTQPCNISITITKVGGIAISPPVTVDFISTSATINLPTACGGTTAPFNYTGGVFVVN